MSIIIKKKVIFLDSMQVLKAPLESLAANLEDTDCKYALSDFPADKLQPLKKNDAYPYERIDDYRKFNYPRVPPIDVFNSRLNSNKRGKDNGHITKEEHNHLNNLWQIFNFKIFKDFHYHYLKNDVLLLADELAKFIKTCIKYYSLDPCHYFSAPGLSWDAMLKMTGVILEKISNPDRYIFIERGITGGICVAIKKYSKENNKFCSDYDNSKPGTEIKYDDMNNLYGKAIMSYLPYGSFKWIKVTDKSINTALNKKDNSSHGYFFEVDMYCPDELHDEQNDFPMEPEKLIVTEELLSAEQIEIIKQFGLKISITQKLIPNLFPKKNYIAHYRNLKYYLANGWKLTKVHRILEFNQCPWMKPHIDFNTEKRMQATNEADKNFFKLSINSGYGKTMENMRKRMKIRIAKNGKDCIKYSSRQTFKNSIIFGKNLVAIHERPEEIRFNEPIYIDCTVLEESKLEICKFWYDVLKKVCEGIKLIHMDTDSFMFEVAENFNGIMLEHKEYFDLSNFPKDSKYYDSTNRKVPDKMKDVKPSQNIDDVRALKSKSYIVITADNEGECKHKGHDYNFTGDEYKYSAFSKKVLYHPMKKIISIRNRLYSKECM